ncbi:MULTISPECIES: hypothetical protein [unclassified Frankia]|uniref:hypothetical protein n=2 Tax=Frankia TaxID=1854 RepID=UPI001EF40C85|nr:MULTISPECIES: hypothetical protein [unclassified Frankia]
MAADTKLPTGDIGSRLVMLADALTARGDLRSKPWRDAFLATPRHVFLPRFYRKISNSPPTYTPVIADSLGDQEWFDLVYTDETWITQISGNDDLWAPTPQVQLGMPTSSSTMPCLVTRMLEDLDVQDGHRVLEIGTGTGYSTALLCHRLGDAGVVSIEYDDAVAGRAAAVLANMGYRPTLLVADGAAGYPGMAPYDRIITTCSFTHVSYFWVEQARPGAKIFVIFSGSVKGGTSVLLEIREDGTASGFLDARPLFFMVSRPQLPAALPMFVIPERDPSRERTSNLDPAVFNDATFRFLLQMRIPDLSFIGLFGGAERDAFFRTSDPDRFCVARIHDDGTLRVHDYGANPVWSIVEDTLHGWDALGRPGCNRFLLTVTPDEQTLTIPGTSLCWRIPVPVRTAAWHA